MVNVGRVIGSTRLGCQHIKVYRNSGSWVNGKYVRGSQPTELIVDAIATNMRSKSLDMSPEGDRLTGGMNFLTTVELLPNDIVEWRGARFKIMQVTPNIDYGYYRSSGERLNGEGIG